jgi:hypothetical protein
MTVRNSKINCAAKVFGSGRLMTRSVSMVKVKPHRKICMLVEFDIHAMNSE